MSSTNRNAEPSRMGSANAGSTRPSVAPIFQSAAFDVEDLNQLEDIAVGRTPGYIYTRDNNPNHVALADAMACLENAEAGAVFSSGMAAIASVFQTLGNNRGHVIMSRALYGRTIQLAERMQQQFGLNFTLVDQTVPSEFAAARTDQTCFALVETISNPLLEICDLDAVTAALGDVPLVVDATFTTPILIKCHDHGAAIVVHSASKYLNGHGDVMLGVASGSAEMMNQLRVTASIFGANANPFESWLCQRGLRTLPLRMKQVCATTRAIAERLVGHPAVGRVHYPLLNDHKSYELATSLYPNGTGGIISFELNGNGAEIVNRFMLASDTIPFSPSLADARTTISYPAGTSHRFLSENARRELGITNELVRLSVGLEPAELLIGELCQTLDTLL
ncbi:MAG: PLP-dependent transferase [Planctomycetaceae bacterium]|nr:PLP-dependent transferase [Planctomycetaceae bacterium]